MSRPQVSEFERPADFLRALYVFLKQEGGFSVRQRAEKAGNISQVLISQILTRRRKLTADNLEAIVSIFRLSNEEKESLRKLMERERAPYPTVPVVQNIRGRETKNHIFSDWLHPYVKDLVHLRGFSTEPRRIFKMLSGMSNPARIRKSIDFLIKEGFWTTDADGRIIPADSSIASTQEIPSKDIRNFHKKALEIAKEGLITFPTTKRKATTVLISLDKDKVEDFRKLVQNFEEQLRDFADQNPNGQDELMQFIMHMTPVGKSIAPPSNY